MDLIFRIHKIRSAVLIFAVLGAFHDVSGRRLPDYIHSCQKADPEINKCVAQFLCAVHSHMDKGIPEINLPPMDPLILKELEFRPSQNENYTAIFHDVNITGLKNTKLEDVKFDPKNLILEFIFENQHIDLSGTCYINYPILDTIVNEKGPVNGCVDGIRIHVKLQGKLINGPDYNYLEAVSVDVIDASIKSVKAEVDKLFKDEAMGKAINSMLNNPNMENNPICKEKYKNVASSIMMKHMNEILKQVPYDELFVD